MRCPFCGYENTKVVDSRVYFEGNSIKRRRECEKCGKRFTTHEKVVELSLFVIKKNGEKQPYSREKVYNGIIRAFKKRDIENEKIEEIQNEKGLTIFVNTLAEDEGFAISDPERAMILNLKKGEKETYKVELSFSKDIDVEDYQDDINTTLNDSAELLERKEYGKYILTVLDGAGSVLQEVNIEALNQMTMTKEQENNSTPIMVAAFVIIILFIVYKMYAAYKDKSNQEEDD